MATKTKIAPEFTRVQEFIKRYSLVPTQEDLDTVTTWAIGSWLVALSSPCLPVAYPYLYLTGAKGSGKTVLGQDVFSHITHNHESVVNVTGAALFRMIGALTEEGEVVPHYPTLAIDEIDAVYASGGSNDQGLRGVCNAGYKIGSTVPRAAGKISIRFPVYCCKVFMGIDNGRLPDTVADRSIRIDMKKATPEQLRTIQPLYFFDVEDEARDIQQMLADWAVREGMVTREYRPTNKYDLPPRQWEISRTLVQVAHALGVEDRVHAALHTILTRRPPQDSRAALYNAIMSLFEQSGEDRHTTKRILEHITSAGVHVPGDSGKGLQVALQQDGIGPKMIRFDPDHPDMPPESERSEKWQPVARGYMRYFFDDMFAEFTDPDEDQF